MKLTNEVEKTIQTFIIDTVGQHPHDLVQTVMNHFGLARPTVSRLLQTLIDDGVIVRQNTKGRYPGYMLATHIFETTFSLESNVLQEDLLYYEAIRPYLEGTPKNVQDLLEYSSMEIINNAIEHSNGTKITIKVSRSIKHAEIAIHDDGVGIFNKIQKDLGLLAPQQSILELCKGKFSSDPKRHSGEGIFFSSRMVDKFIIRSYGLAFNGHEENDMIMELSGEEIITGTWVSLQVDMDTARTPVEVFNKYADPDMEPSFHRTCIPVRVMNVEGGNLVSRSQAKRLLARVDRFLSVVLDFSGVEMIGQAFADEIFRVFASAHKNVSIQYINANATIEKMIRHVLAS